MRSNMAYTYWGAALAAPTFCLKMDVSNYVGVPDIIIVLFIVILLIFCTNFPLHIIDYELCECVCRVLHIA